MALLGKEQNLLCMLDKIIFQSSYLFWFKNDASII